MILVFYHIITQPLCNRVLEVFSVFKMWLGWPLCPWRGGSWCGARRSGTGTGDPPRSGSGWRGAWTPPWLLLQPLCPPHSLWLCLGDWTVQTNKTGKQMREIEALLSKWMICSQPSLLHIPHPCWSPYTAPKTFGVCSVEKPVPDWPQHS